MKNAKIVVISPTCSKESAEYLAELLGGVYEPALKDDYRNYDVVVNYGSSRPFIANRIINKSRAVQLCVNKISTLKRVKHGVEWTKDPVVALGWLNEDGAVVSRAKEEGSRSEGVTVCVNRGHFETSPGKFWTRYFYHDHEVRINCYKGKVLSVFDKVEVEGFFEFQPLGITGEPQEIREMIDSIQENIGIDIYGMDVLVSPEGEYKLLEVNSGATIHEETKKALVKEIKQEIHNYG